MILRGFSKGGNPMSENNKAMPEAEEKKKLASKKLWGKVACALLAILMWIYVSYDENPKTTNTYTNIPVTINGIAELEQRNITVLSGELTVAVKISGTRNALSRLNKSDINAVVDVSNITGIGEQNPIISIVGIPDSLSVEEKKVTSGKIVTDILIKKVVEVGIDITGTMHDNIVEGEKSVSPAQITVKGPNTLLENVTAWTEAIDVSGIAESENIYNTGIVLKDSSGSIIKSDMITKSDNEATVTINCLGRKEVKVNAPNVVGSLSGYIVRVESVNPDTVVITGAVEDVESIESVDVDDIDAYYTLSSKSFARDIRVPEGIECEPTRVTVSVSVTPESRKADEEDAIE